MNRQGESDREVRDVNDNDDQLSYSEENANGENYDDEYDDDFAHIVDDVYNDVNNDVNDENLMMLDILMM